jgi:hypothetical protein
MDDGRLCLHQGQRDVIKGLSHEIKMGDARLCAAFSRDSEMLESGIFLLEKDYLMRL